MAPQPKWTKRSAQVMEQAVVEAKRRGADSIYAEHLLIALVMNEGGIASNVLRRDLQLEPTRLVELIDEVTNSSSKGDFGTKEPELSSSVHEALRLAQDEARRARHYYIGTEHLLLGLVGTEDQVIQKVLGKLNHTPQTIRLKIHELVPEIAAQKKFGGSIWYRLRDDFYDNLNAYVPKPIRTLISRLAKYK